MRAKLSGKEEKRAVNVEELARYRGDNSRRLGKQEDAREIPVVPKFIKRARREK
jgi:hypothetical protein